MLRRRAPVTAVVCLVAVLVVAGHGALLGAAQRALGQAPPVAAAGQAHAAVFVPVAGAAPVPGAPWFLTIGDSITFGYTLDRRLAGTNGSWPVRLQRMLAVTGRRWRLYDTACPSESTVTYATRCPSRAVVPFLTDQSQRHAALTAIAAHGADLRLIVVALGANDVLGVLGGDTARTAATLVRHLDGILDDLQRAAPGVPVVLADVYDPFVLRQPASDAAMSTIDAAVAALASRRHDGFADFHAAINRPADGTPLCGLIDCADHDIHPTALGQQHLAEAALAAVIRSG